MYVFVCECLCVCMCVCVLAYVYRVWCVCVCVCDYMSEAIEIPLLAGSIKDVVNFLAERYAEEYQYSSLNAYYSAVSSIPE